MSEGLTEILCARTPAVLHSPQLKRSLAFYRDVWEFEVRQQVPGVLAILVRESVTVQLWQRRADRAAQTFACRLLVDNMDLWRLALQSAPGQRPQALTQAPWGSEFGLSDCDGNRLLLVQSAARKHGQKTSL